MSSIADETVKAFKIKLFHTQELMDEAAHDSAWREADRLRQAQLTAIGNEKQPLLHSSDALRASLQVKPGTDRLQVVVVAGGLLTTRTTVVAEGTHHYDYALAREFGNSHEPARPFFFNTYRRLKNSILQAMANDILKPIQDLWG